MSTLASVILYQFPSTEWIDDILLWPPVDFPSLFIEIHTGEAQGMQKSGSLHYYQGFIALMVCALGHGWVQTVIYHSIGIDGTHCILKAKTNPSQMLNDKPPEPWVAVDLNQLWLHTTHVWLGEIHSYYVTLQITVF